MTELDTILSAIDGLRGDVREDTKALWKAIEEDREKHHVLDKKVEKLKMEKKIGEDALLRHIKNQDKHFNPYFSETYPQKMRRKLPEIGTSVTIGGIIFGIILAAAKYAGWF